jgi:hypothetical protein
MTTAAKKIFTVDQANQTLPLVRVIVQDIVDLFRDVQERRERLDRVKASRGSRKREESVYSEELEQIEEAIEKDIEKLKAFVEELQALGVEFKDPMVGLVDFPTRVDGREAYLCWKLGEGEIGHWHDLEGGYKGRRPLKNDIN